MLGGDASSAMLVQIARRVHQVSKQPDDLRVVADLRSLGVPRFIQLESGRQPRELLGDTQQLDEPPLRYWLDPTLRDRQAITGSYVLRKAAHHRDESGFKRGA